MRFCVLVKYFYDLETKHSLKKKSIVFSSEYYSVHRQLSRDLSQVSSKDVKKFTKAEVSSAAQEVFGLRELRKVF
jgi:hypothetical protein